jgi:hypothetical protein
VLFLCRERSREAAQKHNENRPSQVLAAGRTLWHSRGHRLLRSCPTASRYCRMTRFFCRARGLKSWKSMRCPNRFSHSSIASGVSGTVFIWAGCLGFLGGALGEVQKIECRVHCPQKAVAPVIRSTFLQRFLAGTRTVSPVAWHVLATVLPLPPRRSNIPHQSVCETSCCLRPNIEGSAFG